MMGIFNRVPSDILSKIFEYDDFYKQYYRDNILPELVNRLRQRFENIHATFPRYLSGSMDVDAFVRGHPYLKLVEIMRNADDETKWKCNGGIYIESRFFDDELAFHMRLGMVHPCMPDPIPVDVLADYIYFHTDMYILPT